MTLISAIAFGTIQIKSHECVSYIHIGTSFMTLLDSKYMSKDLHITYLTLLRKIVEVSRLRK